MYAADACHPDKTLQEKLQAIYKLRGGPAIDLTIREPYTKLLAALGNPHQNLPPVIHIAGTNGKGSVIAMLRAVFEKAGSNVHAYTSPHLHKFNERIVLAGHEIEDEDLEILLNETMAANEDGALTFFEITTALAFLSFARTPADICLLETGLGGRLDCTNVIANPLATIITRIGYDHMEFLGGSLPKIAAEKAGILKPGVPCILGPQSPPEVETVFENRAKELGCPLIKARTDKNTPPTNMTGPHQIENAATAITCLQNIDGFSISEKNIRDGLKNVHWPGRLQKIPYPSLPEGCELWFDGGHNESAGRALAAQAQIWQEQDGKKLHVILGMMKTKDPLAFLEPLFPYISGITATGIPDEPAAFKADEITAQIKEKTIFSQENLAISPAPQGAIKTVIDRHKEDNIRILLCGSLYLSGKL